MSPPGSGGAHPVPPQVPSQQLPHRRAGGIGPRRVWLCRGPPKGVNRSKCPRVDPGGVTLCGGSKRCAPCGGEPPLLEVAPSEGEVAPGPVVIPFKVTFWGVTGDKSMLGLIFSVGLKPRRCGERVVVVLGALPEDPSPSASPAGWSVWRWKAGWPAGPVC